MTDSDTLGKVLDGAMTETFALHSENNTPYKLNPAKEEELASLKTEIMDESMSESMKAIASRYAKTEEKDGDGPETMDCGVECLVCREEFVLGQKLHTLPHCGHIFHVECLQTWFKHQNWCPVCRTSILGGQRSSQEKEIEASLPHEKTPEKVVLAGSGAHAINPVSGGRKEDSTVQ